jgi:hypothetical protein
MNSHGVIRVVSADSHHLFQRGVATVIDRPTGHAPVARGYFLKSVAPENLVAAIRQVHAGSKRIQPGVLTQTGGHRPPEQRDWRTTLHFRGSRFVRSLWRRSNATLTGSLKARRQFWGWLWVATIGPRSGNYLRVTSRI